MFRLRLLVSGFALALSVSALAGTPISELGNHTGLGQPSAKEPAQLRNLRLDDPLVQRKYLNEPDMMRFLRGTYSEGCARGLINQATRQIILDPKRQYDPAIREQVKQVVENQRLWKMNSFELEVVFRDAYLKSANYCDCLMKEVADVDLVNPRKGMDVLQKLPPASVQACERLAVEKTEQQLARKKKE